MATACSDVAGEESGACDHPVEAGVTEVDLISGDRDREYRRFVPGAYDGSTPTPVVLNFHGLTGNATDQALGTGVEVLADEEGFIAVHPQGLRNEQGNTFFEFGIGDSGIDDVGFTADILDQLEAELCIDTTRVYSMGMSNGGYMSSRLACDLSDRLAAVAPVSATIHPEDCASDRPVPIRSFHGTADDVVPFDGGVSLLLGGASAKDLVDTVPEEFRPIVELLAQEIPDEVDEWAESNGCEGSTETAVGDDAKLVSYDGCDAQVDFYVIDGGGHDWFRTADVDATRLAWEFFQQHSR